MSRKIAMITRLPEHQECTSCHCFSQNGYMLRDSSMARFVCEECYETTGRSDYPLAAKVVELSMNAIEQIVRKAKSLDSMRDILWGKRRLQMQAIRL